MNKIAVIGGSGFVGSHIVADLIKAGNDVISCSRNPDKTHPDIWKNADITNTQSIINACEKCDVIYHLAALHKDNIKPISLYEDINVNGTKNLCEAADKIGTKHIIFMSTVAVYGKTDDDEPNEDTTPKPNTPYGKTKLQAEQILKEWQAKKTDRKLTIIRPPAIFGSSETGTVYSLIKQIEADRFIMIGNGKNKKSLAYLPNLSEFLVHALSFKKDINIYNYVDKPDLSMNELVSLIRQEMGKKNTFGAGIYLPYIAGISVAIFFDLMSKILKRKFPISKILVQKFCRETIFSSQKLDGCNFTSEYKLENALRKTVKATLPHHFHNI